MKGRLGMAGWARCWMLALVAGAAIAGFGAASAWALPPQPALRAGLVQALQGSPTGATEFDAQEATLSTKPVKVTVRGVTYLVDVTADANLTTGQTTLTVSLDGLAPRAGQYYDYTFSPPSGIGFRFRTSGTGAVVKASKATAPSRIDATYAATSHQSLPCTLRGGSRGHMVFSSGTVSFSAFRFVSGSSPVFGTITKHAAKASFAYDPGCGGEVKVVNVCSPGEVVATGRPSSPQQWAFGQILGERRPVELALATSSVSPTETLDRQVAAEVRAGDLPAPMASPTGATARVRTTGNPLMTGSASFASTRAPTTRTGRCRDEDGSRHTYSETTYAGRLTSDSPLLTVSFSTGSLSFPSPQPARLYLTSLTS